MVDHAFVDTSESGSGDLSASGTGSGTWSGSGSVSDSESVSDGEREYLYCCQTDSGNDEAWLRDIMAEVESFLTRPTTGTPSAVFHKWRAIRNLMLVYHKGMRDAQLELEAETGKVHATTSELRTVTGDLKAAREELDATRHALQLTLERGSALQSVVDAVSELTRAELERWELIDSESESD